MRAKLPNYGILFTHLQGVGRVSNEHACTCLHASLERVLDGAESSNYLRFKLVNRWLRRNSLEADLHSILQHFLLPHRHSLPV
jgi:hypothetical protein